MNARIRQTSEPIEDEDEFDEDEGSGEDDLLQPSLSAQFDVRRFGALYDPRKIMWSCFFGGPIAGGMLFGLNYRRMREPRSAILVWIGALLVTAAVVFAGEWVIVHRDPADAESSARRLARFIYIGVSVLLGWLIERHQRGRFDAYVHARRHPRPLLVPAIASCIAGFVGSLLLILLMTWLFFSKS